jgi:hypothetical protein
MRPKQTAALMTLARRSHFYLEKFVTPAFTHRASEQIRSTSYGSILYSYLTTTRVTDGFDSTRLPEARLIWTHNDEFKWFRDLAGSASSLLGRQVARTSERWLHDFFGSHLHDYTLLHVTEADRDGYLRLYPEHKSIIVPIGVDIPVETSKPIPPGSSRVRLTFVGSLGVRMNLDALNHFANRFYPPLHDSLGLDLEVVVAGSAPSQEVLSLCRRLGWSVQADLSETELAAIIDDSTFTILPFDYATGAKLKLLKTLAHGVPFLATERVSAQSEHCVDPSLISEDPSEWLRRIRLVLHDGIDHEVRSRLQTIARNNSWEASTLHLVESLGSLQ